MKFKFKFKARDFDYTDTECVFNQEAVAARANALLEAHEKTLKRVYGHVATEKADSTFWNPERNHPIRTNINKIQDSHTALLWGLEEIRE